MKRNILVIRFSALGDITLTIPVLRAALEQNPELNITLLTRAGVDALFVDMPRRLNIISVNLKEYSGLQGLMRLFQHTEKQMSNTQDEFDLVIDLHNSSRSKVIRYLYRILKGKRSLVVCKGRRERYARTRRKNKSRTPLPHITERYASLFIKASLECDLSKLKRPPLHVQDSGTNSLNAYLKEKFPLGKESAWIGIAPFAGHKQKMWSIEKMITLIEHLLKQKRFHIFLFGTEQEMNCMEQVTHEENVHVPNRALKLEGEIALLQRLDVMLTMDSFNMHLASFAGTPLVSIWGATDPVTGFAPFDSNGGQIIMIDSKKLPCRPCAVYGNRPCYRKDLACMNEIMPDDVLKAIEETLR